MPNFTGTSGNDVIEGTSGADTMTGLAGNDIYYVNSAGDLVVESGGQGTDTVRSTISYLLAANIEQLRLLGTANINATGNSLANLLVGNSGNNILDGGLNGDTMKGGGGNDIYYVNSSRDVVVELGGEGTDTVRSEVNYTLGDNVEQLRLLGSANINGNGNALNNLLVGNSGNNALNGKAGADTMRGELGNDTYYVDNVGDVVVEDASSGTDTIRTTISLTLADNVERGVVNGTAGLILTGNALANQLVGGSGADTLIGLSGNDTLQGGIGADTMIGGVGNDTYFVDNLADVVVEAASAGTDTIRTTISLTLADNVERGIVNGAAGLVLTGNGLDNELVGGSGADELRGDLGDDVLKGGDGNDSLYGGLGMDTMFGGEGDDLFLDLRSIDTLYGGPGDDRYFIEGNATTIVENDGEGTDTVVITAEIGSFTLPDNVENAAAGFNPITVVGNGLDNNLDGYLEDDELSGMGGNDTLLGSWGADTMTGGSGNDIFFYQTAADSKPGSFDQITDFLSLSGSEADDQIDLSGIDANSNVAGNQAFAGISVNSAAYSLWWTAVTNGDGSQDLIIYGDTDGNKATIEFELHIHALAPIWFEDITM